MNSMQAALNARVSSAHQAEAHTVASQVVALRERIAADGLPLPEALQCIDEGSRGATLVRPALERLRDVAAAGAVDRLYVHSPDRLARTYAYQVLLVDECQRAGVEVIFLNRELGRSPEDDLLLHVQGMMAEYERAKLIERHRRGKRHAARAGAVNVLSGAPYGYRSVPKSEGHGQAHYEMIPDEGRVVPPGLCVDRLRPPDQWGGLSPPHAGGRVDSHGQDRLGPQRGVGDVEESCLSRDGRVWEDAAGAPAAAAARPAWAPAAATGCAFIL
jgi:DNA invertase Pin-like site-specific DNA recombinase